MALVITHVITHGKNRLMAKIMNHEWRALPKKQQLVIMGLRDEVSELWDEVLTAGQKSRAFTFDDVKITRMALIQMCSGVSNWYSPSGPIAIEDLARNFADMALGTVQATAAGKPLRRKDLVRPVFDEVVRVVAEEHVGAVRETK